MESSSGGGSDDGPTREGGVPVYVVSKRQKPTLLRQVKGPGAPRDYTLDLPEVVVGRSLEAHISIESESISRRHAAFERTEDGYSCRDLDSRNGLLVNGNPVKTAKLRDGDSIQVGDALFLYHAGS